MAPGTPLLDPFCGSGTLAIEGALMARRMAPGRRRGFAFERWPGIDPAVMARVRDDASARELASAGAAIIASDRDAGAIEAARGNAERAGVGDSITFVVGAVSSLVLPADVGARGAVVTNPPYGVRVGESGELRNLYARTGQVLRATYPGWRLALISAEPRLTRQLAVPLTDAIQTNNGGLPVTFLCRRDPRSTALRAREPDAHLRCPGGAARRSRRPRTLETSNSQAMSSDPITGVFNDAYIAESLRVVPSRPLVGRCIVATVLPFCRVDRWGSGLAAAQLRRGGR
jgi:hypothetical protein